MVIKLTDSINLLERFFNPCSITVIGASKNPMKGGNQIVNNLITNGYNGKIYPVNPNYGKEDEIYGFKFEQSVLDIKDEVELAIFYVNNRLIPSILKDCVEMGIPLASIQSAGFEEVGLEGLKLKNEIEKITDNFTKMRIIGPNCMGISRFDGDFESDQKGGFFTGQVVLTNYKRGNVAIITQSGTINAGTIHGIFRQYPNLGFRYIASIGNKMDLGENEFLDYILTDPTVNVIALYLESFKEPREFISLCRKAKILPRKTIILLKGGKTNQGMKATSSHTGALAENVQLIDAIIKQSGVIQANTFMEMFQFIRTFSMMYKSGKKFPRKGNIAVVVGSGGWGTVIADITMKYGLNLPEFDDKSYRILKSVFPSWMPPNRFALVDSWPTMEKAMKDAAVKNNNGENEKDPPQPRRSGNVMQFIQQVVLEDPNIEALFASLPGGRRIPGGKTDYLDSLLQDVASNSKPIFYYSRSESEWYLEMSRLCGKYNIPVFAGAEDVVKNFAILVQDSQTKENLR
jgi:acetyltransferase